MPTQRYSFTPQPIDVLLAWVKAGEIAIHRGEMSANLWANCLPESFLDGTTPNYERLPRERRRLMAQKLKKWSQSL